MHENNCEIYIFFPRLIMPCNICIFITLNYLKGHTGNYSKKNECYFKVVRINL
jgi:hypothetical protein